MSESVTEFISHGAVCKRAPATPGLLTIFIYSSVSGKFFKGGKFQEEFVSLWSVLVGLVSKSPSHEMMKSALGNKFRQMLPINNSVSSSGTKPNKFENIRNLLLARPMNDSSLSSYCINPGFFCFCHFL